MAAWVDEDWPDSFPESDCSRYRAAMLVERRKQLQDKEAASYAAIGARLVQLLLNDEGWNGVIVAPLALDPSGIYMELCSVEPGGIERALGGTN